MITSLIEMLQLRNFGHIMMNCFYGMVDQRRALTPYFQPRPFRDSHHHKSPTPQTGFEPAQNLISDFVEWSFAVVITTTQRRGHVIKFCWRRYGQKL